MKTVKTWLFTIASLLCSITANAHDFQVDGFYYNVTSNTTVSVTYWGSGYHSYRNEYFGNVVIPSLFYGLRIVKLSPNAPTAKIKSITKGAV